MKKKIIMVITMVAMMVALIPSVVLADTELPDADVNSLGKQTVEINWIYDGSFNSGTGNMELPVVMQFLAKETGAEATSKPYGAYDTDFYITISGLSTATYVADEDCYIAGNYGTWGWVKVPLKGMTLENGKTYPVMKTAGLPLDYTFICEYVQDFKCGIHLSDAMIAANPDIKVGLELGMIPTGANKHETIGSYSYDKYDFNGEPRPVPPTTQEPQKTPDKSPNTGDNTAAPFAVAGLALAAMAAAVVARRRYN